MKQTLPLRFDEVAPERLIVADDGGMAFSTDPGFVERYATDAFTARDEDFLRAHGYVVDQTTDDLPFVAALRRLSDRFANPSPLNYLILVPTLRCDLDCSYCQVSRVNENRPGFDWTDVQLGDVKRFLDTLETDEIQIEFQGGEPLLRVDILEDVAHYCRTRFERCRFIVCTNLGRLDEGVLSFIGAEDVFISTSMDGGFETHKANRTRHYEATQTFFDNLAEVIARFGADKVSALPTIDYASPPAPNEILDAFERFGMRSIYLRPVNYQGFARKQHRHVRDDASAWNAYHERFVLEMLERTRTTERIFEEFSLSLAIRRLLQSGHDKHVDMRNPGYLARDYLVVDFDGRLYPTDEARMLTRTGVADLSIGTARDGITEPETLAALQAAGLNNADPDCQHCVFQPACGSDPIDDISRYGRIDLPRSHTVFCQRQTALFRLAWRLILSDEPHIRRSVCQWLGIPYTVRALVPHHA